MSEKQPFIHLHTHSHYSFLDGMSKIPELVNRAKELGMPAIALTDHGSMHGAIEFYKECKDAGIKPIVGVEAYMAERSRHEKEHGIDNKLYHLTLLAKNYTGYQNLMKLVSKSYLEGYYYKPRMDEELLREYSEGIICLSGCPGSKFITHLKNGEDGKAKELLQTYIDIFGKENVFVEVMNHEEIDWYQPIISKLIDIANEFDLPLVGTWDSHYLHADDREAHDTLLKINTNNANFKMNGNYSLISSEEAERVFSEIPGAYENTKKVADMCELELTLGEWVFPELEIQGDSYDEELKRLAYEGLDDRGFEHTEEVINRLEYELKVIRDKGYSVYFLIVGDLLREAHERNIHTTIRGSVAGSLVTYCIRITNVDPLTYKLPFERFLNPERPKAPDIDMDFADDRRDEMIEYSRQKYGDEKVAQIGTFGTMMARGSVRDVARALGYPYDVGDRIAKEIPMGAQGFPMTIGRALKEVPELKEMYENERDTAEILDMAQKIEGCARHVSVHAAGVVIAPSRIDNFSPVQIDPKGGKVITQYDMHAVEDAGLVKFDFLGIRNLSILSDAVKRVEERYGDAIDIENIPLNDKKTFELLGRGETIGLFQLNGSGMTKYLMDLKPTTIHDINAMVALYRPGPMEYIPSYIERKYDPTKVTYLDDRLRDILDQSFGIIAYQDDVLMIAIKLAGFSWLEADKLRKAMGKKIPEEMEAQKEKLLNGFKEYGELSDEKAQALWKQIEPFAAYGFNKAHAASYGKVAYQTSYMKANYPVVYMAAVLSAEAGDTDKIAEIISECIRMDIEVLPPDINESYLDFTVVEDSEGNERIRFGLYTIKNVGEGIAQVIIDERTANGTFQSISDFMGRITRSNLNRKTMEALIKCGAFDSLGERGHLLHNLDTLLHFNKELTKHNTQQNSLFAEAEAPKARLELENAEETEHDTKLAWEKDLLGLYITGHPLDKHREKIEQSGRTIAKVKEEMKPGMSIVIAGVVDDVREILTKKQERMAFVKLSDMTESIEAVIFPKNYESAKHLLAIDQCVAVKAKASDRNGDQNLIIEKVKEL